MCPTYSLALAHELAIWIRFIQSVNPSESQLTNFTQDKFFGYVWFEMNLELYYDMYFSDRALNF